MPLVAGLRRDVEAGVDAGLRERLGVLLGITPAPGTIATQLGASVADKDQPVGLLEGFHVGDVGRCDAAAAEQPDVGEGVGFLQGDGLGLHASHGQAGHGPASLVGLGAEVCVDVRYQLVTEHGLERLDVEFAQRPETDLVGHAVGHHHQERPGGAGGDQVIQNQARMALDAPPILVLAEAVLQVQDWITLVGFFVIARRGVDEGAPVGLGARRLEQDLAHLAVGHVLHRVEVGVMRRDLHTAPPPVGPEVIPAVGVRDFGPIDLDGVVVEALVEGARVTDPGAVRPLGERGAVAESHADRFRLGRDDAELHPALAIHLGIFLAGLVGGGRLEVLGDPGRNRCRIGGPSIAVPSIASHGFPGSLLVEDDLGEMVQVVPPMRGIMPVAIDIPNMGNTLILQEPVRPLADADEVVLVAAGKPQQLQGPLGLGRIRHQFSRLFGVGRG